MKNELGKMILVAVFFSFSIHATGKWEEVKNIPTLDVLNGIYFTDTLHGWAVGDSGTIIRYNGSQWEIAQNPVLGTDISLKDVHFIDTNCGWVVGSKSTVLQYDHGIWEQHNTSINDTAVSFNSVHFLNEAYGWIVGDSNTLLHYNGSQWIKKESPVQCDFKSVFFTDSSHGWVGGTGEQPLIYYNGTHFTSQIIDSSGIKKINSLHFINPHCGWAVGQYRGVYYKLRYNGEHWTPFSEIPSAHNNHRASWSLQSVFFVDSSYGWISGFGKGKVTGYGYFFQSDGMQLDQKVTLSRTIFYDMFFLDSLHGWAVGRNMPGGIMYRYIFDNSTPIVHNPQENILIDNTSSLRIHYSKTSGNQLIINCSLPFSESDGIIKLYSIKGTVLISQQILSNIQTITLRLQNISPQTYILVLQRGNKQTIQKIPILF